MTGLPSWKDLVSSFTAITRPTRSDWIFALRTTAAGFIALLIAYSLGLENPHWAMMTVFIVAQPVAGMVLAKGFYRLVGTLAGAMAAIGITKLFGFSPWIFVAVLALWIGLCTFVSSLLRNPEAYGAALAGYTATIIGLPAFGQPHLVTDLAVARCSEIMLGIACAGITSRLVLPQLASEAMSARLKSCIMDLAAYASGAFAGEDEAKLAALHRKLVADTQTLGEMRAYARLEAPSQATRAHPVRRTIGYLLSALSAARTLHAHPRPADAAPIPVRGELRAAVTELAGNPAMLDDTASLIERFDRIAEKAHKAANETSVKDVDRIGAITRLVVAAEFADMLKQVLRGLEALRSPKHGKRRDTRQPALVIHRDYDGAIRNAIRAAVATLLFSAFWLATRWSELTGIIIIVGVVTSLFASRPDPMQVSWGFFKGTLLAMPVAFVIGQLVLPNLHGFGWFMAAVIPVLIPATLAMANPRTVGVATAFAINFLAFLSPHQVMTYAPMHFLAGSAAVVGGILLGIGVFATVLPANPHQIVMRLVGAMRDDLVRLCLHERVPRRPAFESLAYDRINQLMPLASRAGEEGRAMFAGSIAAVAVGLDILRLRRALQDGALTPAATDTVKHFLARLARELLVRSPRESWNATIADMRREAAEIAEESDTASNLHAAASLRVIAAAVEDNPAFFHPDRN